MVYFTSISRGEMANMLKQARCDKTATPPDALVHTTPHSKQQPLFKCTPEHAKLAEAATHLML